MLLLADRTYTYIYCIYTYSIFLNKLYCVDFFFITTVCVCLCKCTRIYVSMPYDLYKRTCIMFVCTFTVCVYVVKYSPCVYSMLYVLCVYSYFLFLYLFPFFLIGFLWCVKFWLMIKLDSLIALCSSAYGRINSTMVDFWPWPWSCLIFPECLQIFCGFIPVWILAIVAQVKSFFLVLLWSFIWSQK